METAEAPVLLVTIPEACRALGVGPTTCYALIKSHEITQVRIGRRSLITVESIEAYVNRLKEA